MKLTAILLFVGCLHVCAGGFAQKVTMSKVNVPLRDVLMDISRQTGVTFSCKHETLERAGMVSISVKEVSIEQVLSILFKNQPLVYSIQDNIIVITEKPDSRTKVVNVSQADIGIKGRVVNENEDPIAGVTVAVKGGSMATSTNGSGEFELSSADRNAVLVFSGANIETFEFKVSGREDIVVRLRTKINKLDEVQVIAYGTTTQRFSTGDISTVKAKDIEKQPVTNPFLALQGRVPGLVITQNTGVAGGGISVRVLGQNSINVLNGNDPLIVIDGVPYVSQMLGTTFGGYNNIPILGKSGGPAGSGGGNPLSYINPQDIESIDILKDADATAIYGSRAANGAVLITTKKGKPGQSKIDFNVQNGWGKVAHFQKMMNTQQYLEMRREAFKNDNATPLATTRDYDVNGLWDTTRYTDWQKTLIGGTAKFNNYTSTVSGGSTNTQYLFSGTYHRETTVYPGDFSDRKGSIHFSVNSTPNDQRLRFQLTGTYVIDNNQLPSSDLTLFRTLAPNAPNLYNADGSLNWAPTASGTSSWTNPLSYTLLTYRNKANNLLGNAVVSYTVFPGLEIKSSFGYTDLKTSEYSAVPLETLAPESRATSVRKAAYYESDINSWIIEPQADYKRSIWKGKLNILVGSTIQQRNSNGSQILGQGYATDQVMEDIKSAPTLTVQSTLQAVYKYNALFGRVNYNLLDKYILNFTARRDGSSRFGIKSQFHNFGAIGAAWIFNQENFVQKALPFLSFGKLRVSYGTTGNDQIPDYAYMLLYNSTNTDIPYQGVTGLNPNVLPNPYLQWEETRKLQVGTDLGLINDRILITVNYVYNRSSNQLLGYSLPSITGFTGITSNFPALVQNTAWEFAINTSNIKKADFNWTSSFNLTIPKNKLVSFPNLSTSSYANTLVIGQPLGVVQAFRLLGVNSSTGQFSFADSHNNPTASPVYGIDNTVLINPFPTLYGGLQNSISYKGFQLDFFLQFQKQITNNTLMNGTPGRYANGSGNQPVEVLNRWQKAGDNATYQYYTQGSGLNTPTSNATLSNFVYTDASYIRLKNASLSWNFPTALKKKLNLQNCRIYVLGQNLLTVTKFKGLDPESVNTATLPPLRVITVGAQISF